MYPQVCQVPTYLSILTTTKFTSNNTKSFLFHSISQDTSISIHFKLSDGVTKITNQQKSTSRTSWGAYFLFKAFGPSHSYSGGKWYEKFISWPSFKAQGKKTFMANVTTGQKLIQIHFICLISIKILWGHHLYTIIMQENKILVSCRTGKCYAILNQLHLFPLCYILRPL